MAPRTQLTLHKARIRAVIFLANVAKTARRQQFGVAFLGCVQLGRGGHETGLGHPVRKPTG